MFTLSFKIGVKWRLFFAKSVILYKDMDVTWEGLPADDAGLRQSMAQCILQYAS